MKELLEDIEKTWKMKHVGSEKEILQHYAEESRTFTIQYACKLLLFYNITAYILLFFLIR